MTALDEREMNLRELASYFNPGGKDWEHYDGDAQKKLMPKIYHQAKRYVHEYDARHGTNFAEQIEKETGDTLYNSLKNNPGINLVVMLGGYCTPEEILRVVKLGIISETKKYHLCLDSGDKLIRESWLPIVDRLNEIHAEGLAGVVSLKYPTPTDSQMRSINALLSETKLPKMEDILGELREFDFKLKAKEDDINTLKGTINILEGDLESVRNTVAQLKQRAMLNQEDMKVKGDGTIPEGNLVFKNLSEVFPDVDIQQDMEVPFWEWEGVHPDVPDVDKNYIFRPKELLRAVYSLITNQRAYFHGHTGTGKTTLIQQMAARLNYPCIRINFDSEITRMDLIGRDKLEVSDEGVTISNFELGMLPRAMLSPCITIFDEIDFVRPDVAYVMQAALEGRELRITEDGDRLITPHPMFRMFATGNTVGQGDEFGMYQGARAQSLAFLDRFVIWAKVDYLADEDRLSLLKRNCPSLTTEQSNTINKYVTEHINAFENKKVLQPISPRGMLAIGNAVEVFGDIKEAINMTVIDRATDSDKATLLGILDRVV